jgi:hypothetical protein
VGFRAAVDTLYDRKISYSCWESNNDFSIAQLAVSVLIKLSQLTIEYLILAVIYKCSGQNILSFCKKQQFQGRHEIRSIGLWQSGMGFEILP